MGGLVWRTDYVITRLPRYWVEELVQIERGVRPTALNFVQKVRMAPIGFLIDSFFRVLCRC